MPVEALVALIGLAESVLIWYLNKKTTETQAAQHAESMRGISRNSIENMIMWDQFNYLYNGKLPTNYEEVHDAYDSYHANGGNGVMTKRVRIYDDWYDKVEEEFNNKKGKK